MKNVVRRRRKPVEKSRHLSTTYNHQTMKKTLSITFIAALLAVGTALASHKRVTTWVFWEGSTRTGIAADIKNIYCKGANNQVCAVNMDNGYEIVFRP